mgnify:CR=1 FL=1
MTLFEDTETKEVPTKKEIKKPRNFTEKYCLSSNVCFIIYSALFF